jgi:hypothetical protein
MAMDPLMEFYLAMAQAGQYAGKPGSQLNSGDLSSFLSPNLGLLTGTLTDTSQTDDDIYASVAPNISRVRNNPDADPIATLIVQNLEGGFSLPQTLAELRKQVSGGDLKAYQEYAKEVSKEMGEVKSAFGKRKTVASQAGFPEPNAPYDPTPMMSNIYARLMQQAQPIAPAVVPPVKKKNEAGLKALAKTLNPISLLSKIPVSSRLQYKEPNAKAKKEKKFQEEQYTQANEARAKIAGQEAEDVKNFLAASMQRNSLAGSPFMDEVMKRTIMKRLLENPAAINKLTKSQG